MPEHKGESGLETEPPRAVWFETGDGLTAEKGRWGGRRYLSG